MLGVASSNLVVPTFESERNRAKSDVTFALVLFVDSASETLADATSKRDLGVVGNIDIISHCEISYLQQV